MSKEITFYIDNIISERGEPQTLEEAWDVVSQANKELMFARHRKYGPNNIAKFGLHGVIIRSSDKLERLSTMVFGNNNDKEDGTNESVEDSLSDNSNYSTIGILVNRGWWGLKFDDEKSSSIRRIVPMRETVYSPEALEKNITDFWGISNSKAKNESNPDMPDQSLKLNRSSKRS